MVGIHNWVQVIYYLLWNRQSVICICAAFNIHSKGQWLLIIKRELALPFLSREICSALFKHSIILCISLLILVIEHLKLLAHLAVSWELSLTIRILIYVFIGGPCFHLVFQLLPEFFLLLLRNLNRHSLLFIFMWVFVFSSYFLSEVLLVLW